MIRMCYLLHGASISKSKSFTTPQWAFLLPWLPQCLRSGSSREQENNRRALTTVYYPFRSVTQLDSAFWFCFFEAWLLDSCNTLGATQLERISISWDLSILELVMMDYTPYFRQNFFRSSYHKLLDGMTSDPNVVVVYRWRVERWDLELYLGGRIITADVESYLDGVFPPEDSNPMIQTPLSIAPLGPKSFEQSLNNANWQTVNPDSMRRSAQRFLNKDRVRSLVKD